jgi:hypothetical protein
MGLIYTATQTSAANSTSADSVSLKAVNRSFGVRAFTVSGLATASAANEISLTRNTGGTITTDLFPPNTQTPSTSVTKFGVAQATTVTTMLKRFGVNGNGAVVNWAAPPGLAYEAGVAEQMGFRGVSGTSLLCTDVMIEQY